MADDDGQQPQGMMTTNGQGDETGLLSTLDLSALPDMGDGFLVAGGEHRPSITRDMISPGKDARDLYCRTILTEQEARDLMEVMLEDAFINNRGRTDTSDEMQDLMALRISVGGRGRSDAVQMVTRMVVPQRMEPHWATRRRRLNNSGGEVGGGGNS